MKEGLRRYSVSDTPRAPRKAAEEGESVVVNDSQLRTLQQKCDAQVSENATLVAKLRAIVTKFKNHKDEFSKCKEREQKAMKANSTLTENLNAANRRSEELRARLDKIEASKKDQAESEALQQDLYTAEARIKELENSLLSVTKEKDLALKSTERLKIRHEKSMSAALHSLSKERDSDIQSIQKRYEDAVKRCDETRQLGLQEETKLRERLKASTADLMKSQESVESLREQLEAGDATASELVNVKESLRISEGKCKKAIEQYNVLREKAQAVHGRAKSLAVELKSKEETISELKASIVEKEKSIESYGEVQSRAKSLVKDLNSKEEAISELKASILEKEREMENHSKARAEAERLLVARLDSSEAELKKRGESVESLRKKLEAGGASLSELANVKESLRASEEKCSNVINQYNEFREKTKSIHSHAKSLANELKSKEEKISEAISTLNASIAGKEEALKLQVKECEHLARDLESTTKDRDALQETMKERDAARVEAEKLLVARLESSEAELKKREESVESLRKQLEAGDATASELANVTESLRASEEKCKKAIEQYNVLREKAKAVQGRAKSLAIELKSKDEAISELKAHANDRERLARDLESTTKDRDALQETMKERDAARVEAEKLLVARLESSEAELKKREESVESLRKQLEAGDATASELANVTESLRASEEKCKKAIEQYNVLREKAKAVQGRAKSLAVELKSKDEAISELKASIVEKEKSIESHANDRERLARDLESTTKDRDALQETVKERAAARDEKFGSMCSSLEMAEVKLAKALEQSKISEEARKRLGQDVEMLTRDRDTLRMMDNEHKEREAARVETENAMYSRLELSETEIARSRESNSVMKKKLKAGWSQYEKLKKTLESLEHNSSTRQDAQIKLIETEAQDRLEVLKAKESLVEKLQGRLRSQLNDVEVLRSRVEELQDEMSVSEQTHANKTSELLSVSEGHNRENKRLVRLLGQSKSSFKTETKRLQDEKRAVENELRFLTKRFEEEQSKVVEVDQIRNRLASLDEQRREHIADLTKTDLSIINEIKTEKEAEIMSLRESINKERQRVEQFKQKLRDVVSMCSKYKDQNSTLKQRCADAHRQVEIGKTQIIQLSKLVSGMR
eukprot:g2160.t1